MIRKRVKKPKNTLEYRNGRLYENGKMLRRKDYIFHADAHESEVIISCVTGQKYRLRGASYV